MNLRDLEILCAGGIVVMLGLFCIAFVWAAMTLPANDD
jgi:hypothetical protein